MPRLATKSPPGADPQHGTLPRHVAVIMDGNGRWAQQRRRPRAMGHRAGQDAAEKVITTARERGIRHLTLFAFSSENWQRPPDEVQQLFGLLANALERQLHRLAEGEIRLRFIGDESQLSPALVKSMRTAEAATSQYDGMHLNVALSYGGRWDIMQAVQSIVRDVATGAVAADTVDESLLCSRLALADTPDVDLFIRTGGESRISNFLLWNLAYAELYFTECLWPDFGEKELDAALAWFAGRQRRFGALPGESGASSA